MKPLPRILAVLLVLSTTIATIVDSVLALRLAQSDSDFDSLGAIPVAVSSLLFAMVGTVVLLKKGNHAVAWAALSTGFFLALFSYVDYSSLWFVQQHPGEPFTGVSRIAAAARQGTWVWGIWSLASLALVYPSGRFPSNRWRVPYYAVTVLLSVFVLSAFVLPAPLTDPLDAYDNPLGIAALEPAVDFAAAVGLGTFLVAALAICANMLWRAVRSTGDEREQFKWFASTVAVFVLAQLATGEFNETVDRFANAVTAASMFAIPLSIGVAILRYRLYEIDVLLSKTLVYAPLTAVLAGTYTAAVLFFRFLLVGATGKSSDESIVLTTLFVAAMFLPVKNLLQSWVDRLFKEDEKKRLDAYLRDVERTADMLETRSVLSRFAERAYSLVGEPVRIVLDDPFGVIEHPEGAAHSSNAVVIPLVEGKRRIGQIEVSQPPSGVIRPGYLQSIRDASLQLARIARLTGSVGVPSSEHLTA